jgi:alpha-D-ribose 1-methylphosphonate 5-triphosphate synthase subunit PhnH
VPSLTGGPDLVLRGPGINDHWLAAPQGLPADFLAQWADNRVLFPRGVDLLLVSGGQVMGLPRTTRITMEAH